MLFRIVVFHRDKKHVRFQSTSITNYANITVGIGADEHHQFVIRHIDQKQAADVDTLSTMQQEIVSDQCASMSSGTRHRGELPSLPQVLQNQICRL